MNVPYAIASFPLSYHSFQLYYYPHRVLHELSVPHPPNEEYWAPLSVLSPVPFLILVSNKEAVCFAFPTLFYGCVFSLLANSLGSLFFPLIVRSMLLARFAAHLPRP